MARSTRTSRSPPAAAMSRSSRPPSRTTDWSLCMARRPMSPPTRPISASTRGCVRTSVLSGARPSYVGSLVLTTNDIVTTGGLFDTTTGAIRFRGTAGSVAGVTVNGEIHANQSLTPGSSYVALVAPRVAQNGLVDVYGSAAYVAAESADIRINAGLFDIDVLTGTTVGQALTHPRITPCPEQPAHGPAQRRSLVRLDRKSGG